MRRCLWREYEVTIVDSGQGACEAIRQGAFDVIIIDIYMPDISGTALYDWLEEHYPALAQRVLFTTGASSVDEIKDLLKHRTCPLMPKPFTSRAIREYVDLVMSNASR
jgi:DNA-binding NtrC family response regulator